MMSLQDKSKYDDQTLTRYLLGALPAEEAERLDELSIADDDMAARLDCVENDLVDAYARGEVTGEKLKQFESLYLSSPKRRVKVELAQALLARERTAATAPSVVVRTVVEPAPKEGREASRERRPLFSGLFQWGFAVTAAALLLVAGYLLFANLRLRKQVNEALASQSSLEGREQQLRNQLDEQRSANAQAQQELQRLRNGQPNLDQITTISLLLPPPTRGISTLPSISLRRGTDLVVLLLTLESDDFPAYRVALKDPGSNQALWQSASMSATSVGEKKAVSVSFRAGLLKQQNYLAELTGVPTRGSPELIGGYPFRVVLK
jgi:Tfp pilus assembly protein PilN